MFWFGTVIRLMAYMTTYYAERIGYYFLIPQVIMIPYLLKGARKSKNRQIAAVVLVSSVVFLWFWDNIYLGSNATVPYQWVLNK